LNDVLFETTKQPGQPKEAKTACAGFESGGGIAQLGERLHGMQEVSGSIPLTSTNTAGSNQRVWVGWLQKLPGQSV
jgi:hypothetical protein